MTPNSSGTRHPAAALPARRARRRRLARDAVLAAPAEVLAHRVGLAGKCSDRGDDTWFPPEPRPGADAGERAAYEDYARAACLGCAVMPECRELALRIEARPDVVPHGISGGLAPWERAAMIRARRAPRAVAS